MSIQCSYCLVDMELLVEKDGTKLGSICNTKTCPMNADHCEICGQICGFCERNENDAIFVIPGKCRCPMSREECSKAKEKFVSQILNEEFKEQLLDWYDGPLSFFWISNQDVYYGHFLEDEEGTSGHAACAVFAFVRISTERKEKFEKGEISIRNLFLNSEDPMFFEVDFSRKNGLLSRVIIVQNNWEKFTDRIENFLPEDGIFLYNRKKE